MARVAFGIAAAVIVGACAGLPEPQALAPGAFELSGRVAIHHAKESTSGRIFWRHSNDADELLISSPIGQGIARIERQGDRFELLTGKGEAYRASDAESLTEQVLGWRLPLAGLSDWVRARANPGRPAQVRGQPEQGLEIVQDGWKITYGEFREGRPLRLRLVRQEVEIRLVVDQWTN